MNIANNPNLEKIWKALREMRRLNAEAVRLENKLTHDMGPAQIRFKALDITVDAYPRATDKVLVEHNTSESKSGNKLTVITLRKFKKTIATVEKRLFQEQASWRTLPGIGHFTGVPAASFCPGSFR